MVSEYTFKNLLNRQLIAKLTRSPELVRALEALSSDVGIVLPANEAEITRIANMALALAAQALIQATDAAATDEPPMIPGPRGQPGADGLSQFLVESSTAEDDPVPVRGTGAAISVTGSRASGAALVSLLAALVQQGVIVDNTTA